MARVTVRSFAALRELAGPTREEQADTLADLLAQLTTELGPEFARRLARSTVVVGDTPVAQDDARALVDGDTVVLLPPFAGG